MKSDMIHRTNSEGGASSTGSSPKIWRIPAAIRKPFRSSNKDDKNWTNKPGGPSVDPESHEPSIHHETSSMHETVETSYRQLQSLVARMRAAPSGPSHVDGAYKEFAKINERCVTLCDAILREEIRTPRNLSNAGDTGSLTRQDSAADTPRSPGAPFDQRSSFSGRSLAEVVTASGSRSHGGDHWLTPVRDWKTCLEVLTEQFKQSLAETYMSYERDATPEMLEALFTSKKFRREAVHRMRNASVTKILSADPQFFPRYEIRFRNYERVKQELREVRKLLQAGESGISPGRVIQEFPIAPRGDAVLEFANLGPDSTGNEPALRFRVSSALLAETSPVFARMFSGNADSYYLHEADDVSHLLPPPPVPYFCDDGSEVKLYRMPQQEFNHHGALEILLHAAHMHNDKIPRDVTFEQFVSIAECCLKFKSTSPLEMVVEHRWLPQWMHKGADDMPDGLLIISYAFGLRQLFTRMSKSAILNLADEKDLHSKPWPKKIKDKVWAVRCAKVDQLYASCASTIQEYLRPPAQDSASSEAKQHISLSDLDSHLSSPIQPAMTLTSTPRCPKGNHWCDASNLGWMMLVYNELGLLPTIVQPTVMAHAQNSQVPSKSLAQMMETLRSTPSPPAPLHPGSVCDPVPAFRAAIADIYNSVTGLTLFDISGKSHGWALSKHKMSEPQLLLTAGLNRMAAHEKIHSVVTEFPEEIRLRILSELEELEDLQAAARINRGFYQTYKRNELQLMRNILRADRMRWGSIVRHSLDDDRAESKVLKEEADRLKERGFGDGADAITLRSEEDEGLYDSDEDDDSSVDPLTRHGSISSQGGRMQTNNDEDDIDILTRDPPPPFRPQEPNPPPPLLPVTIEDHEGSDDDDTATPTTPRQRPFDPSDESATPSDESSLVSTEDIEEPPMTEEEARRILWPDHMVVTPPPQRGAVPPGVEGLREKFRVGDISFIEGLEDKTLAKTETKLLRSDHDERAGLLKQDGRPSSSSSTAKGASGVQHIEEVGGRKGSEDELESALS
ncbi:hypothetical protein MKX07_006002 [Trichoderma sp. CBMAI-0711]|uniref:Uncharacterized protein n=1 Tax=Trichoderma parareesei TaxID=858221 RepID=A0A2H2Z4B8_TRIPA|nr:hypothetical protein MKX07_006002 [Trichoderma sp. CBMAI-0711]OTA00382.1 hypothetical protein A9Z42_0083990 [Trichoderma parareesei]